jgi:hypothetical protein
MRGEECGGVSHVVYLMDRCGITSPVCRTSNAHGLAAQVEQGNTNKRKTYYTHQRFEVGLEVHKRMQKHARTHVSLPTVT